MNITIAAFLLILCIACAYVARKMSQDEAYQREMRGGPPPVRHKRGRIITADPEVHDALVAIGIDCKLKDEVTGNE